MLSLRSNCMLHARYHARPSTRRAALTRSSEAVELSRRALLVNFTAVTPILLGGPLHIINSAKAVESSSIKIISDSSGVGSHAAREGDLLLIHYIGILESGQVFDSTRGGLEYRDGGLGVFRPAIVLLGSSSPTPGLVRGLKEGLVGMTVGGKRTILVPPEKGFGDQVVGAPYALVPPNSTLRYEVELLRLSTRGPDELTRGISRCGAGGASASSEACESIEIKEFI